MLCIVQGKSVSFKIPRTSLMARWVSDCCKQFFSCIMARTSYLMKHWWCPLDSRLVGFLQCWLTETTVCWWTFRYTRTHYPDSESTSFCSQSLMLCALWRNDIANINLYSLVWSHTCSHPWSTTIEVITLIISTCGCVYKVCMYYWFNGVVLTFVIT